MRDFLIESPYSDDETGGICCTFAVWFKCRPFIFK